MLWSPDLILQIRSNILISYFRNSYHITLTDEQKERILQGLTLARENTLQGILSLQSKKRIAKCIDVMIQTLKGKWITNPITQKRQFHKLSFLTLTISTQKEVTIRESYDLVFKHFLQWLRRTMKVKTYIWKVEEQLRGQPHYHITTPTFLHYQQVRDKWNNLQRQAGWINKEEHGSESYDPNSTDIHEVRKVNDLSNYMKKEFCKAHQSVTSLAQLRHYLSKNLDDLIMTDDTATYLKKLKECSQPFKIWDASENLTAAKYHQIKYDTHLLNKQLHLIKSGKLFSEELEQCSLIKLTNTTIEQLLSLEQLLSYDLWKISLNEKIK